ncbi:MAG: glycoside hydrolase family 2 protein, partial [Reichenbachiella sp.]
MNIKSTLKSTLPVLLTFFILNACQQSSDSKGVEVAPSSKETFNQGWGFKKEEDANWIEVTIPHTPQIEPLVVNDQWQGKSDYRKIFEWSPKQGEKVFVEFEGVMSNATVAINGNTLINHLGGYLPFVVDLSDYLVEGKNELTVEVLNVDDASYPPGKAMDVLDFNTYGGIYRDVHLIRKSPIYITHPNTISDTQGGVLVHFDEVNEQNATGQIQVELKNESVGKVSLTAIAKLIDKNGQSFSFKSEELELLEGEKKMATLAINLEKPLLWDLNTPNLYELEIQMLHGDEVVDVDSQKVGVRSILLNEEGFFLNGQKQYLTGTNRHQEYPYVGYAISNEANWRDAVKIKNAGFDFVRLSHYPQDNSFLDACDALGIIVMDAIPGWQFFAEGEFADEAIQNIRDMVRRDRNHASVCFWEVSLNESNMSDEFMIKANQALEEELPFEDTYSAGWMDHDSYELFIPARQHSKPPYYYNQYKEGKRNVLIAEYGDWEYYAHDAGFNQSAFEGLKADERTSRQLRAHGERRLLQQALNFQEAANSNKKGVATIGMANWLMFDYNRGYADDIESSGISDIFRIPKFAHAFYQSQRNPYIEPSHEFVTTGPMVEIASYWSEHSSEKVTVYSNCEEVALYLNDVLVEKKRAVSEGFSSELDFPPFHFSIEQFEAGELV